ncbi:MAG: membrane protein insertion efficiency factor YidD [Rhodospirillales bacterium 69-11]|nr:membrane protein insertion efficiency factor YidD [Rhodospirillales bacterium]MBN8925136.1 membrane protein insertion efficiency factor YidD [Rhodospirillales bacterium]OJW27229.1 MAG: membrane protein insertion efficiency factor YidD [Rhodospirillales bacterium 69-11]
MKPGVSGVAAAVAATGVVGLVRTYQWTLRPLIGANCRFWPSCSEYAIEAVRMHGALRGSGLAARRILRCNPWHPGGVDPVPPCTHGRRPNRPDLDDGPRDAGTSPKGR